jgi:hypothetical protein
MRIEFNAKSNWDECRINKAYFKTVDGSIIGVDRVETDYNINDNDLSMEWINCYIWEVNGCMPFNSEEDALTVFNEYRMQQLLKGAKFLYFELEDDAPENYSVTDVTYAIS